MASSFVVDLTFVSSVRLGSDIFSFTLLVSASAAKLFALDRPLPESIDVSLSASAQFLPNLLISSNSLLRSAISAMSSLQPKAAPLGPRRPRTRAARHPQLCSSPRAEATPQKMASVTLIGELLCDQ